MSELSEDLTARRQPRTAPPAPGRTESLWHRLRTAQRASGELRAALARERAARRDAERVSRAKDEFLAMLSHELRTPLNAIVGWTALLRSGTLAPPLVARALEVIERNAGRQTRLINELLDMSRIITGKLSIDLRPVDLLVVVSTAVESARPQAEAHGLGLTGHLPASLPPVFADAARLEQVLANLLSNAVKFTPAGGRITVGVREDGAAAEIRVADTGRGIPPEMLGQIFEPFHQAAARASRHGGLGLGLTISRTIVERHGGTVVAESAGVDQGTTVTVRLPLSRD